MTQIDTPQREPWKALLLQVLQWAKERDKNPRARAACAVIRQGATPFTQVRAYPYVLPAAPENARPEQRNALLRVAALAAEYDRVPHSSEGKRRNSLGRWAYRVATAEGKNGRAQSVSPDNPGMIAARLAYLHTQDMEEAARSIKRIFEVASTIPGPVPPVNYFDIADTLMRWGNGVSPESQYVRMRVIEEFYSAPQPKVPDQSESVSAEASEN
ncbi:type I-E CRISPR-associated protein Cse2/CasB [Actinotignum timonense]|uniref:type I-E CRISPR-associated protein Cse2/CasB n=1 Tax=Actinotignum TaxID=1653174 RepID=UPI0009DC3111|nr:MULTISPECIES: type I-E CRISPR-associated protein Cse2/CasB [Actinotignum]MDY5137699.1 type I-E CRISPR-associated protein Cse2/CasB [Actinotignum timonense]WQN45573.1 type I-E CRISPR-associated protein Cse2/CasB [Actinotignum schaalii]